MCIKSNRMSDEAGRKTPEATADSIEKSRAKKQKIYDFYRETNLCRERFQLKRKGRHRFERDVAEDLESKKKKGDANKTTKTGEKNIQSVDRHIMNENFVKETQSNSNVYYKITSAAEYPAPVFDREENVIGYRTEIERLLASIELDIKETREMLASARRQFS